MVSSSGRPWKEREEGWMMDGGKAGRVEGKNEEKKDKKGKGKREEEDNIKRKKIRSSVRLSLHRSLLKKKIISPANK